MRKKVESKKPSRKISNPQLEQENDISFKISEKKQLKIPHAGMAKMVGHLPVRTSRKCTNISRKCRHVLLGHSIPNLPPILSDECEVCNAEKNKNFAYIRDSVQQNGTSKRYRKARLIYNGDKELSERLKFQLYDEKKESTGIDLHIGEIHHEVSAYFSPFKSPTKISTVKNTFESISIAAAGTHRHDELVEGLRDIDYKIGQNFLQRAIKSKTSLFGSHLLSNCTNPHHFKIEIYDFLMNDAAFNKTKDAKIYNKLMNRPIFLCKDKENTSEKCHQYIGYIEEDCKHCNISKSTVIGPRYLGCKCSVHRRLLKNNIGGGSFGVRNVYL